MHLNRITGMKISEKPTVEVRIGRTNAILFFGNERESSDRMRNGLPHDVKLVSERIAALHHTHTVSITKI